LDLDIVDGRGFTAVGCTLDADFISRAQIRSWNLHPRSDKSIEDLSRMFNPIIRG